MSNWANFTGHKQEKPEIPSRELEGTFMCQVCDLHAEVATYYYTDHVLKWKCPENHVSFAENFRI